MDGHRVIQVSLRGTAYNLDGCKWSTEQVGCSKPSYQLLVANLVLNRAWLQVVHRCPPEIEGLIIHQVLEIIHGCQGLNIHLIRTFPSTRQILINIQNAALVMHPRNHDNSLNGCLQVHRRGASRNKSVFVLGPQPTSRHGAASFCLSLQAFAWLDLLSSLKGQSMTEMHAWWRDRSLTKVIFVSVTPKRFCARVCNNSDFIHVFF